MLKFASTCIQPVVKFGDPYALKLKWLVSILNIVSGVLLYKD